MKASTRKPPNKCRFSLGDVIGYVMKDLHGHMPIVGVVTGYNSKVGLIHLTTIPDNVAVSVEEHVPVLIPMIWADSRKPVA